MYKKEEMLSMDIKELQEKIVVCTDVGQTQKLKVRLNELLDIQTTYSVLANRSKGNKFVV